MRQAFTRVFLWSTMLGCGLGLLATGVLVVRGEALPLPASLALAAALTIGAGAGLLMPPRGASAVLRALMLGIVLLTGANAYLNGRGLLAPALLFFGLTVGVAFAIERLRFAVLLGVLAAAVLLALAYAEAVGALKAPAGMAPLALWLFIHLAMIAIGAALGAATAWLLARHSTEMARRAQRFRQLLAIAADAYWETDAHWRLVQVDLRDDAGRLRRWRAGTGGVAWDQPELQGDPQALARLREQMQSGSAIRNLPLVWQGGDGRMRHIVLSGEPRREPSGAITGYWGVARDVSDEHAARHALDATQARYQTLFERTPSPLILHCRDRIVDANPAAAALLGYDSVAQMVGVDIFERHLDSAGRAESRARLAAMDAAAGRLPMTLTDRVLIRRDGRSVHTRATAVRAEHGGEPAVLVLMVDETDSRAAALARQRSETLLSRVVSTSPDVITLTDAATGRYVMVNDSFCRTLGYVQEAVIGRTSLEIGVWHQPADRERMMRAIDEQGMVHDMAVDFVAADGRRVPLLVSAKRFDDDGQAYLLINARDVSESNRVRLEREAILDNASIGIAFTRDRRFVLANARFEQTFGWPPGTLPGQLGRVAWPSDADFAEVDAQFGPALRRGESVVTEREACRRDGSRFVLRLAAKAIDPQRIRDGGTIWIAEDVTEKHEAARELARARDAAEAANRAKSAFLANTSHEIRTPLNGLLGLARLARQPGIDAGRRLRYLEQIGESAETLAAIISDILDLSKIEAGKLEIDSAPFDLAALLQSLHQAYGALAAEHGLGFEFDLQVGLPSRVRGDALRLRQILANLLQNALKFTEQGAICLRVRRPDDAVPGADDGLLRLEVHDTGPGIDAATQARLFEPFTQADQSATRRFGGTGLGLSICRELAALMGGRIALTSAVGRGSCFAVELPLPEAPEVNPQAADAPHGVSPLLDARVLMVEDNPVNMMISVALLEHWGVRVTEACDGRRALAAVAGAAAQGLPFQAVVMDVQMPGMSGFEATELLRRQYGAAELPVIALTAAVLVSERERAVAAGMTDFLSKPVDPDRLHAALVRALRGAGPPQ